ncbi:S1 family peptidase [Paludisphaera borealis]|nr:serine protease [Paludisphaera borealis]
MRTTIALAFLLIAPAFLHAQDAGPTEPSPAAEPAVRIRRAPATSPKPAARAGKRQLDPVAPGDDGTFRPTVIIRRGTSQGSGTVVASVDDDTLVLTAAHVVRSEGPILVELHRYNLGLERRTNAPGRWPRRVPAQLVGADASADVAVLRVRQMVALPYVAKLSEDDQDALPDDSILTSVGIDLGAKLSSWKTELVETASFQLNESDVDRPFLITDKIPEHGRSGGGLFTGKGRLVGVCVGHAEMIQGRRMGVFASIDSIHRILREHDLNAVVDRSSARHEKLRRPRPDLPRQARRPSSPSLTPTEASDPAPARP